MISPVLALNVAPLGSAGLTDQVNGPAARLVVEADGVTVGLLVSTTV